MNLALRKQQSIVLLVLVLLTLMIVSAIIFSTVTHFDTFHWLQSSLPTIIYGID